MKPYTPSPIEGHEVSLTKRQELAHIRKALDMSKDARRYWPSAEWNALLADLERQETALAAEIKCTDEAIYGKAVLRPELVNTRNGFTTRPIVFNPNDKVDMPYILSASWDAIRRILNDPTGENIEVNADYEVYVASKSGFIHHVIPRFE